MVRQSNPNYSTCRVYWDFEDVPISMSIDSGQFLAKFKSFIGGSYHLSVQTFTCVFDADKPHDEYFRKPLLLGGVLFINARQINDTVYNTMSNRMRNYAWEEGAENIVLIAKHEKYLRCLKSLPRQIKLFLVNSDMRNTSNNFINSVYCCSTMDISDKGIFFKKSKSVPKMCKKVSTSTKKPIAAETNYPSDNSKQVVWSNFKVIIDKTGGKIINNLNSEPCLIIYADYGAAQKGLTSIKGLEVNNTDLTTKPQSKNNPPPPLLRPLNHYTLNQTPIMDFNVSTYVEVKHNFCSINVQEFMKVILHVLDGSIETYKGSSMLIKLKDYKSAIKYCKHINSLQKRIINAFITPKIVHTKFVPLIC